MKNKNKPSPKFFIAFILFMSFYAHLSACTCPPAGTGCTTAPFFNITVCREDLIEVTFSNYTTFGSSPGAFCACGFNMPTEITEVQNIKIVDTATNIELLQLRWEIDTHQPFQTVKFKTMDEIFKAIVTLSIGGILGGLIKTYYDYRKEIITLLWDERLEAYKKFWSISGVLPKWPKEEVKYKKLFKTCTDLKNWYFNEGGILLSKTSKEIYEKLQSTLFGIASSKSDEKITDEEYEKIRELFSDLRDQMTIDLSSRKRRILN